MLHRKGIIDCRCANALFPAQASETNVTTHVFQQFQI